MFLFYTVFSIFAVNNVLVSSSSACQKGTLSCDDGKQCVMSEQWCNKKNDCEDRSDEARCKKSSWWFPDPNNCESTHFVCSNGICVPRNARCNDNDDCGDYSDEAGCPESTEAHKNDEVTTESGEDTSEEGSDSNEEDFLQPDNKDEISVATPDAIKQSSLPTESSSVFSSSTQDYYGRRRKETHAPKQDVLSQTSSSSSPEYVTTSSPKVTSANDFVRTTTPDYLRQPPTPSPGYPHQRPATSPDNQHHRPTSRPDYPRQPSTASQTYDRRGQSFERHPNPQPSPSQTYHPQTYDRRQPTYYRQQHSYTRRPQVYDSSSHIYGGHPQPYDRSAYDRRRNLYDGQSQTLNNRVQGYYNQSPPYDSRASIFSNRIPHPSDNRPSAGNTNALNGEPDWIEVASLKPYSGQTEISKPLHFAKNYAKIYGRSNIRHVREGEDWLLNQRNKDGDWGKDTARALVALALANNSFPSWNSEYELMKRRFITQLSVALLRNSSSELQVSRLSMSMNALFAVCENPRDFHALDLTELLRIRIRERVGTKGYPNPFVYLSLCLTGKPLVDSEVQNLMKKMLPPSGTQDEMSRDMQSLAIQAFSCYTHQVTDARNQAYRMSIGERLDSAVSDLLSRMYEDGSFGSVYSTALAAQALLSVNDSRGWNSEKTVNFLKQQQREDGSFGDLLATYYTLPVLSGRSLLHLRNIQCTPVPVARDLKPAEILEFVGPKQFIHYSIYFGYPLVSSHSLRVLVPEGINFLDVMKVAEHQNKNFRFSYETGDGNMNIYSISGTPNDVEQGRSWHLYVKNDADPNQKDLQSREKYSGDVREIFPTAYKHMIFWYHPIGLRN